MDHRTLLRRVGLAFVLGQVGLFMLLYALERTSLVALAEGADANPPLRIYLTMFVGLAIVNLCAFATLSQWSRYLRDHPDTRQMPVWALLVLLIGSGGALIYALATHAGYLRSLATVPMDPSWGYLAFQVLMATFVLLSLVLLAARWSPGYKARPRPAAD